jgi:hypothetical protein
MGFFLRDLAMDCEIVRFTRTQHNQNSFIYTPLG